MKWKNRLTNYNFWISIISAALLILQAFKFEFDIAYINEISTAVLGLMVVIGIISDPTKTYSSQENLIKEQKKGLLNETSTATADKKEQEIIELPIEAENKSVDDNIENDFQILMNKISADINDNLARINEISNAIKQEIADRNPTTQTAKLTEGNIKENEVLETQPTENNVIMNIVN